MSARAGNSSTFTVGLVQMRSGLDPAANLDAATRLIGELVPSGAPTTC